MKSDDNHADQYHSLQPFKRVESSRTALDKQVNIDNLKGESTKRIFRLLMLLAANECTRQEIFVRLTPYYNVEDIATGIASSSRRTDRMFERDIKLLEEQGFEIRKIKRKGSQHVTAWSKAQVLRATMGLGKLEELLDLMRSQLKRRQ